MKCKLGVLFLASSAMIAPAAAQSAAQDAKSLLQAADKAMGASAVNSVIYSGTGTMRYPGQSFDPNGDWPGAPMTSYTATIDYGTKSGKQDYAVDVAKKGRGGGLAQPHSMEFVSGTYAWNLNAQGQANPQLGAAELRQFMITISPYGFIKAALAGNDATLEQRTFNRLGEGVTVNVIGLMAGKYRVTGEFDKNNLLERIVTSFPDPVLGDMAVEVRYTDWKDVGGGAKFPFHIHAHQGDHPLWPGGRNWFDVRVTDAKVNAPNTAQAVPDNVRTAPAPQVRVASQKLADGVWFIGGGSHNSLAVEFKDFITVIEGPLNDERSNAVIAETHKLIPNKPIRYLVNTHHHFDHLGGIRAFVAEGATVIADGRDRNFYERVVLAPQPRSLSPDRLSEFPFAKTGPGTLDLQTFTDHYTIGEERKRSNSTTSRSQSRSRHADGVSAAIENPRECRPVLAASAGRQSPERRRKHHRRCSTTSSGSSSMLRSMCRSTAIRGRQADFERIVGPVAAKARPAQGDGG